MSKRRTAIRCASSSALCSCVFSSFVAFLSPKSSHLFPLDLNQWRRALGSLVIAHSPALSMSTFDRRALPSVPMRRRRIWGTLALRIHQSAALTSRRCSGVAVRATHAHRLHFTLTWFLRVRESKSNKRQLSKPRPAFLVLWVTL